MTAGNGRGVVASYEPPPVSGQTLATANAMKLAEVWELAGQIADVGMLGFEKPAAVFAVMMLCQAEGIHPMEAIRRYHFIEGKPSRRADSMQAEFQARGGVIEILQNDDVAASALVSHPTLHPKPHQFTYTYEMAQKAGITQGKYGEKANWKSHRADMLWARMVTKAIRKIYPGIVAGIYTPEELEDASAAEQALPVPTSVAAIVNAPPAPKPTPAAVEPPVWGQPDEIDARPYHEVVSTAVGAFNSRVEQLTGKAGDYKGADVHRFLWYTANQKGWDKGEQPKGVRESIERLTKLYKGDHRKDLRDALQSHLDDDWDVVESAYIDEQAEAAEGPPPAAEDKPLQGHEAGLDG